MASVNVLEFAQAEVLAVIGLLRAYVDEFSDYTNVDCKAFGMSGLVGPVAAWHQVQCEWEDALDCCGVDEFHSTDLHSLEDKFKGWTVYQRERLMALLVGIVRRNLPSFKFLATASVMSSWKYLPEY